MACFRPVTAWKPLQGGPIVFREMKNTREIVISCGQCIGCRIAKREAWSIRCMLESKMHRDNCFLTLTYNDENYPPFGGLVYSDFQLFAKRARKALGSFRFFVAGEYGEEFNRPHFHVLMFGRNFDDRTKCNSLYSRSDIYRSLTLEKLWTKGFSSIGEIEYASARYCAAYVCSKRAADDPVYNRVDVSTGEVVTVPREFARMSLKPGIGYSWLEKYWPDIYATGNLGVPVNGKLKSVPKYFHEVLDRIIPGTEVDAYDFARQVRADKFVNRNDLTRERLAVREEVAQARERFNNERRGVYS